jgi:hypothetical protein
MEKMAVIVDKQNEGSNGYIPMSPKFDKSLGILQDTTKFFKNSFEIRLHNIASYYQVFQKLIIIPLFLYIKSLFLKTRLSLATRNELFIFSLRN